MKNENVQKRTYEVTASIDHDLCLLKKEGKIADSKMNTFKTDKAKKIYLHPMQAHFSKESISTFESY